MIDPSAMDSDVYDLVDSIRAFTEKQRLLSLRLAHLGADAVTVPHADGLGEAAARPGPFDELIDSVSAPVKPAELDVAKLPPPSRFMVRSSRLDRPHRATKRNYNYFDRLEADLADLDEDSTSH